MTSESSRRLILIIAAAFAAWLAWIIEVVWGIGWTGLDWIGVLFSPLFACLMMSFVINILLRREVGASTGRFVAGTVLLFCLFVCVGAMVGWLLLMTMGRYGAGLSAVALPGMVTALLASLAVLLTARIIYYYKFSLRESALLASTFYLVPVLGQLTILVLPTLDPAGSRDFTHAVKMGYCAFWAVAAPAWCVMRQLRRKGGS